MIPRRAPADRSTERPGAERSSFPLRVSPFGWAELVAEVGEGAAVAVGVLAGVGELALGLGAGAGELFDLGAEAGDLMLEIAEADGAEEDAGQDGEAVGAGVIRPADVARWLATVVSRERTSAGVSREAGASRIGSGSGRNL